MGIEINLKGRRIVVVGASSGVGRSTALAVAARGGEIAVVGRRAQQLEEVVAAAGGGVAIPADLRDEDACARVVTAATDALGSVDAVLFPVGISPLQMMTRLTAATWSTAFATNVTGPALVTAAAIRARREPGLFLYVSSANVAQPAHGMGAYGASKAALDHSLRTWRLEHPEHRFLRLTIGATMPTEIANDFDHTVLGEVLPKWASNGLVTAEYMHVDDVGVAIAETVAFAFAHPAIAVDDVTLNPASAPVDATTLATMGELATAGDYDDHIDPVTGNFKL
ncbi:SDR family oxidoreductase [Frankia sp. CNm7]|uniref:SDR family oxidoreductase n=1 Tax=Frankia nepalensis TaxID=1836974 RepID=A0A937UPI0_9ACTN|nr:SDR family oxidoreductase [Frankia nepalensis]MBL7499214.1 SDR family oxidoreductase [Frankia nepalensis]MBL7512140.1 SDR family oxidoreductase [Frankia nepalensis]MBL7520911.1 SDR family oxidoreductase [Frankia nepalensis]MBL7627285.1 SDR family oxidoreductase [Frankia nepalensis]